MTAPAIAREFSKDELTRALDRALALEEGDCRDTAMVLAGVVPFLEGEDAERALSWIRSPRRLRAFASGLSRDLPDSGTLQLLRERLPSPLCARLVDQTGGQSAENRALIVWLLSPRLMQRDAAWRFELAQNLLATCHTRQDAFLSLACLAEILKSLGTDEFPAAMARRITEVCRLFP